MVAYPWLASAVTRSPFLIALSAVASRLPWLIFTLPAGVITDRFNHRKIIVAMDSIRGVLTLVVAAVVYLQRDNLPSLDELTSLTSLQTNYALYALLIVTALLFGMAEVLRDNTAQTLLPSVVEEEKLERANGRMWSAEALTNSFIGPPIGSFLIAIAIFLPFVVDATTFFFAAALIATLIPINKNSEKNSTNSGAGMAAKPTFRADIKEGFTWLWSHNLLRPMAIILGLMNGLGAFASAVFILFAQEILQTSVLEFAILGTAGAVGGILGGWLGPKVSERRGSGFSLALSLSLIPATTFAMGWISSWYLMYLLVIVEVFVSVLWNIVTVSLRQSIIPPQLMGRVNSVYRFLAWGSLPLGLLISGITVSALESAIGRESALRSVYWFAGLVGFALFIYARRILTTEAIEAARKG
ncbi:MAG: hypothetical protein RLZZ364_1128 [Actinomycetota bacterium]